MVSCCGLWAEKNLSSLGSRKVDSCHTGRAHTGLVCKYLRGRVRQGAQGWVGDTPGDTADRKLKGTTPRAMKPCRHYP